MHAERTPTREGKPDITDQMSIAQKTFRQDPFLVSDLEARPEAMLPEVLNRSQRVADFLQGH